MDTYRTSLVELTRPPRRKTMQSLRALGTCRGMKQVEEFQQYRVYLGVTATLHDAANDDIGLHDRTGCFLAGNPQMQPLAARHPAFHFPRRAQRQMLQRERAQRPKLLVIHAFENDGGQKRQSDPLRPLAAFMRDQ